MDEHRIKRAPDYTNAALIMFGVNLLWIFVTIWAIWGLFAPLMLAVVINRGISGIAARRD